MHHPKNTPTAESVGLQLGVARRRVSAIRRHPLVVVMLLAAQTTSAASADDWSHWRGPARNGVVRESSQFDEHGWKELRELWRRNVGEGSTSPIVARGRLYTLGWTDGQDRLVCLDAATGRQLWEKSYPCPRYGRKSMGDEGLYSGPISTPELDSETGWIYTLSIDGNLRCWDTGDSGRLVWQRMLYDDFDVPRRPKVGRSGQRDYGYTSSPLIQESVVIVEVGAASGTLVGFDKRTGATRWQSAAKSPPGHTGGPVSIRVEGVPCVAVHHFDGLLVARIDTGHEGESIATYDWKTDFANNVATPAVQDDCIVMTSHYNHVKVAKLKITLQGATQEWEQALASKVCSPVIHGGYVYWTWHEVVCLDYQTGRLVWKGGGPTGDAGSCVVTADDRLILWTNRGTVSLVESASRSPEKYSSLASRQILTKSDAWPHVALSEGRLFCKDRNGDLVCLSIAGR